MSPLSLAARLTALTPQDSLPRGANMFKVSKQNDDPAGRLDWSGFWMWMEWPPHAG